MEQSADVVVIGAGISGCATAYNLAKRGKKVVLLEKDDIAFEASGRTMAIVGPVGKHHPDEFKLALAALEIWPGLSRELGADIELIKGGRLVVADEEKDLELFEDMVKAAEESGVEIEWMDPNEARGRWPFLEGSFVRAAFSPQELHVDPEKTVHAFARAARENGAEIYTGCLVQDIRVTNGRVSSVVTSRGEISTGAVVNVAGAWASRLLDRVGVHIPIKLIRILQGETEPLPRFFDSFVRGPGYSGRQTVSGTIRLSGGYRVVEAVHDFSLQDFRDLRVWLPRMVRQRRNVNLHLDVAILRHDIRSLLGHLPFVGRGPVAPVGLEPAGHPKNMQRKLDRFARLIPRARGLGLTRTWSGFIELTPDLMPVIGPVNGIGGLYVGAGHSHGFAIGPILGRIMADLVIDGKTSQAIHSFRPSRFKEEKVQMPRRLV